MSTFTRLSLSHTVALTLLIFTTTLRADYIYNGLLKYIYDSSTTPQTVIITGCIGSPTVITIPSTIDGYKVTTIGSNALLYCAELTSITVDPQNAAYSSIDGVLFDKAQTRLISYPAKRPGISYSIPNSVISIESNAFAGCFDLTSISIPNSVTSIGSMAFYGCAGLRDISIPNGVTSISDSAFRNCIGMASITIPDSVTSIGNYAFYNSGLNRINIPKGVTFIGACAFRYCYALASVTIPDSVTSIGDSAFTYCYALTSIVIPDSVTSLGNYTFQNCVKLNSLTLSNKITSIDGVFSGCTSLTDVTIPKSVAVIGNFTFTGCTGLTSITIPSNVITIGESAFQECSHLINAYFLGNAPTSFGNYVFKNTASNFTVYYNSSASGFTSPSWLGYNTTVGFNTLENWRANQFTTDEINSHPEISGDTATPAHDGIPNLLKYAMGLDPKTWSDSGLPVTSVENDVVALNYTQLKNAPDIVVVPEVSTDLKNWHSDSIYVSKALGADNGSTQSVVAKSLLPLSSNPTQYMRLRVVKP